MNQIAFIQHAGSGNHGCEAIVDTLVRMLPEPRMTLVTNSRTEDERYLPQDIQKRLDIVEEEHIADHVIRHTVLYAWRKLSRDRESFLRYRFSPITGKEKPALAIGIGGDNYCYPEMLDDLMLTDSMLHRQGTRTILLGCSVEPELLKKKAVVEDLCSYEMITARESITYRALLAAGVPGEKVHLCPDPAFTLPAAVDHLPAFLPASGSRDSNVVGMNLSPLAQSYAADPEIALRSFAALIQHILDTTSYDVALIPHVVWDRNNDLVPLTQLYQHFQDTGRVFLAEDQNAEHLKGMISRCRFLIAARTHASIAAYSTCVPTLVLGYSVKARGIAKDLFGTDDHYVLPIQQLSESSQLIRAFDYLAEHEQAIRSHLENIMPSVIARAKENGDIVKT